MKKVAIIGGGIIGQFIAYYLPKDKYAITIIDDAPAMPPASVGNCGLITPSHITPLNQPGLIWQGIKWMGKKDAPFSMKPQRSTHFYRWILSFIWHSNKSSFQKATQAQHELLKRSWALFEDLIQKNDLEVNWENEGLLFAAKSEAGIRSVTAETALLKNYQLECQILSQKEMLSLEPQLLEDVKGGAIFHVDGWLNPTKMMNELKRLNTESGVTNLNAKAATFTRRGNNINQVILNEGEHTADEYIICNGASSVHLASKLGIHLPIIPGKGYNLTSSHVLTHQPTRPVYMVERKVVATPWTDGFRLGSTMEFAGYDSSLNTHRLTALKVASKEYLKTEIDKVEFTPWAGWRPMSSTGMPLIERTKKYRNLTFAVGHGMLGLSMAPATGEMVAGLIEQ